MTPRRPAADAPIPEAASWVAWGAWLRDTYALDQTGERLLGLVLEAAGRYQQARDVLDRDGLTTADGRLRPEVAVERDSRAALQRLIMQLNLEETDDATQTNHADIRRFTRAG